MCGIIGYIGSKEKTIHVLMNGLKKLEYRGYDSSGIAYFYRKKIQLIKASGRLENLEKSVDRTVNSKIGIGHTRWATHGEPSVLNAHPHQHGKITLVHNGVIENMEEIKNFLIKEGERFYSDTDTEVLAALIDNNYKKTGDMKMALQESIRVIVGSYSVVLLNEDDHEHLYVLKKDSPLLIGVGKNEVFVASDYTAFKENTKQYMILNDLEYGMVSPDEMMIYNQSGDQVGKEIMVLKEKEVVNSKEDYDFYMNKEIHEEEKVLKQLFKYYERKNSHRCPRFKKYRKIQIVGCGSAYHAGLVGKTLFEKIGNKKVEIEYASEFRYQPFFAGDKTLIIFVSQSGETADTIACAKMAKSLGIDTLSIVNTPNSTLSRLTSYVYYTYAGEEVSVATTKAYSCQIAIFMILLREFMMQYQTWDDEMENRYQENKRKLWKAFETCYQTFSQFSFIEELVKRPFNFFVGRQIDYALSVEASLKLREVTYLNSVAYPAGELKHGTIALIEKGVFVFALATDKEVFDKTKTNMIEAKSRGAYTVFLTTDKLDNEEIEADIKLIIPDVGNILQPLITILPFQLLSYQTAKYLGLDLDHPRNLAKSVTVE